eukprot:COSAG06_NODE_4763_length_3974_cov_2.442065_4_plen_37_part_00
MRINQAPWYIIKNKEDLFQCWQVYKMPPAARSAEVG